MLRIPLISQIIHSLILTTDLSDTTRNLSSVRTTITHRMRRAIQLLASTEIWGFIFSGPKQWRCDCRRSVQQREGDSAQSQPWGNLDQEIPPVFQQGWGKHTYDDLILAPGDDGVGGRALDSFLEASHNNYMSPLLGAFHVSLSFSLIIPIGSQTSEVKRLSIVCDINEVTWELNWPIHNLKCHMLKRYGSVWFRFGSVTSRINPRIN